MKNIFMVIFCLVLSSCSMGIPEHELVKISDNNTNYLLSEIERYNSKVIQKADIQSNIDFKFMGKTMNALGLTSIDEKKNNYRVAALNPMGITLFLIDVQDNKVVSSYIIPQFTPGDKNNKDNKKADKAADMISKDISHVYFDRKIVKNPDKIKVNKYNLEIKINAENSEYFKYTFTGNPLKLSTKAKFNDIQKLWSVDYYDYRAVGDKEMPFDIILRNHIYGYRLDIKTQKIRDLK